MKRSISAREMILEEWLLLFFLFSAAGWLWEVLLTGCTTGHWVNRGMLHGPWLPVYGAGGVMLAAALGRPGRGGAFALLMGAALGGGVEYAAAWVLEALYRQRWWSYDGFLGSIHGRVCLASLGGFALAGWVLARLTLGLLERLRRLRGGARTAVCRGVSLLYALDWAASLLRPNVGEGISWAV